MNKPVHIKIATAYGNGAGCRLEAEEVYDLVRLMRRLPGWNKRNDADLLKSASAIAFGDAESGGLDGG